MKLPISAFGAVVIVLLTFAAGPLLAGQNPTALDSEAAKSIKLLIDNGWEALRSKDMKGFKQNFDENWTLFSNDGRKLSVDTIFNNMYNSDFKNVKIDTSELNIHVVGDMAWATYNTEISGEIQGQPWKRAYIFTNIFQKKDGKWLAVHTHESKK